MDQALNLKIIAAMGNPMLAVGLNEQRDDLPLTLIRYLEGSAEPTGGYVNAEKVIWNYSEDEHLRLALMSNQQLVMAVNAFKDWLVESEFYYGTFENEMWEFDDATHHIWCKKYPGKVLTASALREGVPLCIAEPNGSPNQQFIPIGVARRSPTAH